MPKPTNAADVRKFVYLGDVGAQIKNTSPFPTVRVTAKGAPAEVAAAVTQGAVVFNAPIPAASNVPAEAAWGKTPPSADTRAGAASSGNTVVTPSNRPPPASSGTTTTTAPRSANARPRDDSRHADNGRTNIPGVDSSAAPSSHPTAANAASHERAPGVAGATSRATPAVSGTKTSTRSSNG
jgi:hypothetical protein